MLKYFPVILVLVSSLSGFSQKNMQLLGNLKYTDELSDIWGYEDTSGNEYALVGVTTGPSIVDISTNPSAPVELFKFNRTHSIWWDLKTYNGYCYVVNETGGGLFIIDLNNLPSQADTFSWHGIPGDTFFTAHNIFIDEKGYAYLFGFNKNSAAGGAMILDLNTNPTNPSLAGKYTQGYIHDGFVRGDTLWGSEIYNGWFSVVDVSNKANPILLNTQITPFDFTHNCWLSDDGKTLYTTDEKAGAFVAAYDVSDIFDIKEIGRYRSHPGQAVIPHNTFYIDSFLTTSYYHDGVTIVDATKPDNLVEVGFYDTSPFPPAVGFEGCWGVYPYFSSGKIVASDRQEGLFVLQPNYVRAAYLEGTISEATSSVKVSNVQVEIMAEDIFVNTNITGEYKTGVADSGLYDIRFTHPNCVTQIVSGVNLVNGVTTTLDLQMTCPNLSVPLADDDGIIFKAAGVGEMRIFVDLNKTASAELLLRDVNGRLLKSLTINGNNVIFFQEELPQGIYFATLQTEDFKRTIKLYNFNN